LLIAVLLLIFMVASPLLQAAENAVLECLVKPELYVELSSPVDGVLQSVLVQKGDTIAKGQILAKLERSVEQARVRLAKVESSSMSEIHNREVQLEFAKRSQQRLKNLLTKQSTSKYEKDKADTEVKLAEYELKKALEKRQAAKVNLELARAQLWQKIITSPIDGIVIDRYAMVGESVNDRAIMKLAQINPLRVELVAPTEYFGLIEKDMEVTIKPDRPLGKEFTAKVTVVDQLIDPASGSFTVRMAMPNPDEELVSGVNCQAHFDFAAPTSYSPYASRLR